MVALVQTFKRRLSGRQIQPSETHTLAVAPGQGSQGVHSALIEDEEPGKAPVGCNLRSSYRFLGSEGDK